MARIICLDYGLKRVGVAVTDELQIIASPLETIHTAEIISFINSYIKENKVELFVVGLPFNLRGEETDATKKTLSFISLLKRKYPLDDVVSLLKFDGKEIKEIERINVAYHFSTLIL